ncbi:hypothetical protein EV2_026327 [Malus domestica]
MATATLTEVSHPRNPTIIQSLAPFPLSPCSQPRQRRFSQIVLPGRSLVSSIFLAFSITHRLTGSTVLPLTGDGQSTDAKETIPTV